jgi:hypothetical protein
MKEKELMDAKNVLKQKLNEIEKSNENLKFLENRINILHNNNQLKEKENVELTNNLKLKQNEIILQKNNIQNNENLFNYFFK